MIKDRLLKLKLLRYFIQRNWYPQLEVEILSKQRVSSTRKVITDIDVLGLYPDITGCFNYILGDCKTLKNQSPISRSLWMKGLMEYLNSSKGIIILQKDIEKDHQLTSDFLNVQLLSEQDFDIYSKHTADYLNLHQSAICNDQNWEVLFKIESKFPKLKELSIFSKNQFWNEEKSSNKLRHALSILISSRRELNPSNKEHLSLVLNHFSLIAIPLNDIIIKIFNRYLLPKSKQELDDDLKMIIWGGFDNYQYLNELRNKFSNNLSSGSSLSLPKWDMFIEYVRSCLEEPRALNSIPLLLKELAFNFIEPQPSFKYATELANKNAYVVGHSLRLIEYLVHSTGLPPEFSEIYSDLILKCKI